MNKILSISAAAVLGASVYGGLTDRSETPTPSVAVVSAAIESAPVREHIEPITPESVPVEPENSLPAPDREQVGVWLDYQSAYAKTAETGEPMVVVFGFEGCAPCAAVKRDIEEDAESGLIRCYVDVVKEPEVAQKFGYVPDKFMAPQVEVLAYSEGVLVRSTRFSGRPAKAVLCGALKVVRSTGKRVASVLKKAASVPVKVVQHVREEQPVRSYFRERAPVRNFVGRCLRCR